MKLYSYRSKEPEVLPHRVRLSNGETRTHLYKLSDDDLSSLGFSGPFYIPEYDSDTQTYFWNGSSYEVRELSIDEINFNKMQKFSYVKFWDNFIESNLYNKFRLASFQEIKLNVFFTEFISLFSDAKAGVSNQEKIQKYINILFLVFPINQEDRDELTQLLKVGNLDLIYLIPSENFHLENEYSWEKNDIIFLTPVKPFESWVWRSVDNEEKWNAPIDFPYSTPEGKNYSWKWDEALYQLNNTKGWILEEITPEAHSSWIYDNENGWKPPFEPTNVEQNTWDEEMYISDNTKGWV